MGHKASQPPVEQVDHMTQRDLAELIHEHTAAITALERQISTREAIRLTLRLLVLEEITLGQALGILAERAERSDPEQHALYEQAMDALRQMQDEEP